jgi:hypothetical protein
MPNAKPNIKVMINVTFLMNLFGLYYLQIISQNDTYSAIAMRACPEGFPCSNLHLVGVISATKKGLGSLLIDLRMHDKP